MRRLLSCLLALSFCSCEMFVTRPGHVGQPCNAGVCNTGLACIDEVCVWPQGRADVAPSGLVYSENPAVYTVGVTITPNQPSSDGGNATAYSVAPPLPAGLTLDLETGIITGTPTTPAGAAGYVVTAANGAGSTTAIVTITVRNSAPASLTYPVNPAVYTKGTAITPNQPSSTGGAVTAYSVAPELPPGLALDRLTGTISGTPTTAVARATYVVTAANGAGSTSVDLSITVNDLPPSALSYSTNPAVYTKGSAIAPNLPSSSGGTVVSYSVAPALPAGLTLDTSTGAITGTPTAVSPTAAHTVTATTSGGTASVIVSITVIDVPPSGLSYRTIITVYTRGTAITPNAPTASGGAVVSYAVAPSLPSGLALDGTTGVISGTPTAVAAPQSYTVTASNSGGHTTTSLTITVNDQPPTNLTYQPNPAVYTKAVAIAANQPTNGGGAVVSYAVAPSLPLGLSFSTTTGTVSGTPTVLTPQATYTVTATNSGGQTAVGLVISVVDFPPSGLNYGSTSVVYTKGAAITANTPTVGGGPVVSYWISPPLPAGLSLDTTNGVISGTPTAVADAASYVVTATNSGGWTTATLSITVNDIPPVFSYPDNPAVYTKGAGVSPNTPLSTGGAVVSYAVVPALPAGLGLDAGSGVISGTPTVLATQATYVVTGTNSGGAMAVDLVVTVNDAPPAGLTYSVSPAIYPLYRTIAQNTPIYTGGPATSFAVTPALPTGLGLDTTTGVISGTPGVIAATAPYSVTAFNTGGQSSGLLSVTVRGSTVGTRSTIACGDLGYHTCALVNGGVQCWGENYYGQLGNGSTTVSHVPVPVSGLTSGVQAVVSGNTHSCALVNGGVQCWGRNAEGELGNGTTTHSPVPVGVSGLTGGVQAIASGAAHTCALVDGNVRCWGYNGSHQLGDGTATNSAVPVAVCNLPVTGVVQEIASGSNHTCLLWGGGAWCWGANWSGQLGLNNVDEGYCPQRVLNVNGVGFLSGVQRIAGGGEHTCAIVNGGLQCWGDNTYGQLGSNTTYGLVPVPVPGLTSGVQDVAGGDRHTCALVNGQLECWGYNYWGQLGNNATTNSSVPIAVAGLSAGVQGVVGCNNHTCALVNGGVQCWGRNSNGELGDGSTTNRLAPVATSGLGTGVQGIASRWDHSCALVNGGVWCWGSNADGQLGNNATTSSAVPVPVSGLATGVQDVGTGARHTCALVNGGVQCWGFNGHGQLGNGSWNSSLVPVAVSGLTTGVQAIASGATHSCALTGGAVKCWGSNLRGQLGNNTTTANSAPVAVSGLTAGAQAIASGNEGTCAIVDGGLKCWGDNAYGQLGDGTTTSYSPVPVAVSGLTSGVRKITRGYLHACAVVAGGGVQCWGFNSSGQLGNGATTTSRVPVAVAGLTSGAQGTVAGGHHSCALVDGGVRCWGSNWAGELGDGTTTSSRVPVAVSGLAAGVQDFAAGINHTCALVDGGVRCWGYNNFGQLGNGSTTDSSLPIEVASGPAWP